VTVDDIIQTIENEHNCAWYMLFHVTEKGHRYLPAGVVLSPAAYLAVVRHFTGEEPAPGPTLADRRRNDLQAKAEAKNG